MAEALIIFFALVLDHIVADPRYGHPVSAIGWLANRFEKMLNRNKTTDYFTGGFAVVFLCCLFCLPFYFASQLVSHHILWLVIEILVVFYAIAPRGLYLHAMHVYRAVARRDASEARTRTQMLVSRDCKTLNLPQTTKATVESVLENGSDAVFAPIFWYLLLGIEGIICHRVINTLDAMWGYRTDRFRAFGYVAAKSDDLLNWIPSRLTMITYILLGPCKVSLAGCYQQAKRWESPNAGPVMAAGAWAMGIRLGGDAPYHGIIKQRSILGPVGAIHPNHIPSACRLVYDGMIFWLAVIMLGASIG